MRAARYRFKDRVGYYIGRRSACWHRLEHLRIQFDISNRTCLVVCIEGDTSVQYPFAAVDRIGYIRYSPCAVGIDEFGAVASRRAVEAHESVCCGSARHAAANSRKVCIIRHCRVYRCSRTAVTCYTALLVQRHGVGIGRPLRVECRVGCHRHACACGIICTAGFSCSPPIKGVTGSGKCIGCGCCRIGIMEMIGLRRFTTRSSILVIV